MREFLLSPATLEQPVVVTGETHSDGRIGWFEPILVCMVALGQPILASAYLLVHGAAIPGLASYPAFRWISGTVNELTGLLLLWYVLRRSQRGFRSLGFYPSIRGVGIGIALAFGAYLAYALAAGVIRGAYFSLSGKYPLTISGADVFGRTIPLAGIGYFLLTPFFEELIVRAYLMTEVAHLMKSASAAVLISVLLQTSYHLYYGWFGAASLAFMFLVFAIYYARTRNAFPVIVAHAVFDYLVIFVSFGLMRR